VSLETHFKCIPVHGKIHKEISLLKMFPLVFGFFHQFLEPLLASNIVRERIALHEGIVYTSPMDRVLQLVHRLIGGTGQG
jgi:hypothetical protein